MANLLANLFLVTILSQFCTSNDLKQPNSIVTMKTRGRLGNHIWTLLTLNAMKINYKVDFYLPSESKIILQRYFEGYDNLQTVEDLCGFKGFYAHFEQYWDRKIVEFYENKAHQKIPIKKTAGNYSTNKIMIPEELVLKFPLRGDELVDSEEFIKEYEPKKYVTEDCPHAWVSTDSLLLIF